MTRHTAGPEATRSDYTLAAQGVYGSVQGEGALIGVPMAFIRLAGCSVGCPQCDTDYRVASRASAGEIADCARAVAREWAPRGPRWAWITGGEPLDRDLMPLVAALRDEGMFVALATSGHHEVPPAVQLGVHWLSVSPHDPAKWVQFEGHELKLVPGLAGTGLADFESHLERVAFGHYFAQPCAGLLPSIAECVEFVKRHHPRFRLGAQAHVSWGLE